MAHIVIVGQGLRCLSQALQLNKYIADEDWITVVSQQSFGLVKSALPYVSVSLRPFADALVDIGPSLKRCSINHIVSGVKELHPVRQVIVLDDGQRIPFDYLVIADGMEPAFDHISGLSQSANTVHTLVTPDETMRAELAFQDFLNSPGPMTVAISPGSSDYQMAYQYVLNVDRLLRRYRLRAKVPIRFVTPEPYLGHFGIGGIGNSKRLFEGAFRARQIEWVCHAAIDRVDQSAFHIIYFDDEGLHKGRKLLDTRYGMIWPSMRAQRYVSDVEGLVDNFGLMPTNRFLQSMHYPQIFAIGELVSQLPLEPTPMDAPQPCSDFLRESMICTVAGNLAEVIRQRYPLYEPTGNGFFMIDFGTKGAAFLAVPQRPPRNIDRIYQGRFVHVMKRALEREQVRSLRAGVTEPLLERLIFRLMKMPRIMQKAA